MYYTRKEQKYGPAEDSADLAYEEAEFEFRLGFIR